MFLSVYLWVNFCNTKCNNTYLFHIIILITFTVEIIEAVINIIMGNTC